MKWPVSSSQLVMKYMKGRGVISVIGEVLFDIYPEKKTLGGAPFNFACHLHRLGKKVLFFSKLGADEEGEKIKRFMKAEAMDKSALGVSDKPTGRVQVTLDEEKVPFFNILPDMAYDDLSAEDILHHPRFHDTKLIYIGSLIQRSNGGSAAVAEVLKKKPVGVKCFFDINLRKNCYTKKAILNTLPHVNVLKINKEELAILKGYLTDNGSMIRDEKFCRKLFADFPLEWLAMTRGEEGSILFTQSQEYAIRPGKIDEVKDTVGAGDGFAAILAAAYIEKMPPENGLRAANFFASRICGVEGALPRETQVYEQTLRMFN